MRKVYTHTNERQMLGAIVSLHSFERFSLESEAFETHILSTADHPWLAAQEGNSYLRNGNLTPWTMDDLQSFTPLRFYPPAAQGWEGKALIVDPDVFAVSDVGPLLDREMGANAVLARPFAGDRPGFASSVMLLDCARLKHWRCQEQFEEMFESKRDYARWMGLETEPEGSVGGLEPEWNDFDHLTRETRLLHNTRRKTQPWKTGLPVDFTDRSGRTSRSRRPLRRLRDAIFGPSPEVYKRHPDGKQEALFFSFLREALEQNKTSEDFVREEITRGHVRRDALKLVGKAKTVEATLAVI